IQFIRNELVLLKDMGFLQGKFKEEVNWKTVALKNIMLLKDKIKVIDIFISRLRKFGHVIFELNIFSIWLEERNTGTRTYSYNNKISNDDLLCIGVIDLSSEKYNILESNYESLVVCIALFFFS